MKHLWLAGVAVAVFAMTGDSVHGSGPQRTTEAGAAASCDSAAFLTFEDGKLAAVNWVEHAGSRVHTRAIATQSQIVDATIELRSDGTAAHSLVTVTNAGSEGAPMRSGNNQLGYWTSPPEPAPKEKPLALANSVTPEYLSVMGIPLLAGRFFDEHDRIGSERVAVIDDVMALHAFGGQNPLGRHLWTDLVPDPLVVIGVVGHVRYWGLARDDQAHVRDQFYYPFAQVPDNYLRRWSELMSIAVRTGVEPLGIVQVLRHELRGAGRDQVLYETRTLEQLASASLARQRFLLVLFGAFAGLALLLACIGIYGVLAYLTGQRVPEFGVRIALGATARDVMRLVLTESAGLLLVGAAIGAGASWAAGRVLQRLVDGVHDTEPSTFAAMTAILVLSALFASFVPARRASRVDALTALRQD